MEGWYSDFFEGYFFGGANVTGLGWGTGEHELEPVISPLLLSTVDVFSFSTALYILYLNVSPSK